MTVIGVSANDYQYIPAQCSLPRVCETIKKTEMTDIDPQRYLYGAGEIPSSNALSRIAKRLRGLVGVCEAPFFPGAGLNLSSFYNRKELAIRVSIMYSGNSLSSRW